MSQSPTKQQKQPTGVFQQPNTILYRKEVVWLDYGFQISSYRL
jgi:hypothetical protein